MAQFAPRPGEIVTIRADRTSKRPREDGVLHHYTKHGTAIVMVPTSERIDDDGEREVPIDQLRKYVEKKSTRNEKRARQIRRLIKQGVTMFRINGGHAIQVESVDDETGIVTGKTLRAGRVRRASLDELHPITAREQ